jgi:hypothetical protein
VQTDALCVLGGMVFRQATPILGDGAWRYACDVAGVELDASISSSLAVIQSGLRSDDTQMALKAANSANPIIRSMSPSRGPVSGGTLITLSVRIPDLSEPYRFWCVFGNHTPTPASLLEERDLAELYHMKVVKIWSLSQSSYITIHSNSSIVDGTAELNDELQRFLIISLGEGNVALYNYLTQRYVQMDGRGDVFVTDFIPLPWYNHPGVVSQGPGNSTFTEVVCSMAQAIEADITQLSIISWQSFW